MTGESDSRRRRGRPAVRPPDDLEVVRKLCLLGLRDEDLAAFYEVSLGLVRKWRDTVPGFADAMRSGRQLASAEVAHALFRRACGYSHPGVKFMLVDGEVQELRYTEHYPPDTAACIFWLKNRERENWRDRIEHDVENAGEVTVKIEGGLPDLSSLPPDPQPEEVGDAEGVAVVPQGD